MALPEAPLVTKKATTDDNKLHETRLSAISEAFKSQCTDPVTYQILYFEDRFGMLVDVEWDNRKSTNLQKLVRNAKFQHLSKIRCRNVCG